MSDLNIEEALSEITDRWMALDGVNGVGQGKMADKDCIEVLVSKKTSAIQESFPAEYKGFIVRVTEVGDIGIQQPEQE
jgi:hypothetical protein